MKYLFPILVLLAAACIHLACSAGDEAKLSSDYPQLASTTQMSEHVQSAIDPVAIKTEIVARTVQTTANDASTLGIPGASTVALIAGVIGTIAGAYNERRRGTTPLRDAFTQVVQSIESAFPSKTDAQKSALAAMQDASTKQLVAQIKGA